MNVSEQIFLKKSYANGQKGNKKMLNINSHQGIADQKHNVKPYTHLYDYKKKDGQ